MNEESTERLELKIAYLERANGELSDVVYRQQQDIDALKLELANLVQRFESLKDAPTEYSAEEERPPHY